MQNINTEQAFITKRTEPNAQAPSRKEERKIITMQNEYYKFFGELAIALQTKGIKMSFKTLNKVLTDNGYKPYGSSRALARGLSASYREWNKQETANNIAHATSSAIANTFTDQNGDLAWWKY